MKENRIVFVDYLRIVACFLVMLVPLKPGVSMVDFYKRRLKRVLPPMIALGDRHLGMASQPEYTRYSRQTPLRFS